MDPKLVTFIEDVVQNVVGLDVALFYQANPRTFDTAGGVALRTHRSIEEVEKVLERLAAAGVLEAFSRGEGRYTCYALPKDPAAWNLLCRLSEAFLDRSDSRKEIIRLIVKRQAAGRAAPEASDAVGDTRQ
ncbi:MAG: hypothetical protein HPY69_19765 [Armatimonadetes bacterium]|nr:hypothetical protein [Armatimonadota bacterium]